MLEINNVYNLNCLEGLKLLDDDSIDSIVTDPPYELGFMGKSWDSTGIAYNVNMWKECLRVLKPGGHLLSFGGTRTYHRMACAIEDAGFEIRDQIQWLYGCLSDDSEIFTTEGWKNHSEIKENDTVYSYNLRGSSIVKNKVKHVFKYNHKGKMVNLVNQNTDQLLTLNHKSICKEGRRIQKDGTRKIVWDENYKYIDAGTIDGENFKLPLSGYYDGIHSIGKDFAELIGWILSEGHFHKDTNAISIYQSNVNKDKVSRIRYIMGRLNIKHSEYKRDRVYKEREYTEHQFYFSGDIVNKIKEIIPNKKPTNKLLDLPLKEKERLFNGLCLGDGTKGNSDKFQAFYQKDVGFLEWFQMLLHLSGKQGWINKDKYSCSIHFNDSTEIQGKHNKNRLLDYEGIVWCIETEEGNFIARRNGRVFITGNSGFPKSHNISKAIDKKFGAEREIVGYSSNPNGNSGGYEGERYSQKRQTKFGVVQDQPEKTTLSTDLEKQYNGWGTALKPANEPIVVARKPLSERTLVDNVLKWGTGGINIDECRVETTDNLNGGRYADNKKGDDGCTYGSGINKRSKEDFTQPEGRFPANVILDEEAGQMLDEISGTLKSGYMKANTQRNTDGGYMGGFPKDRVGERDTYGDSGGASRFFYCGKASKKEKGKTNNHPTVKPIKLMEYLVKLVTPKCGIVLDPFAGSGTTLIAAKNEGMNYIGFELEEEYIEIINERILHVVSV